MKYRACISIDPFQFQGMSKKELEKYIQYELIEQLIYQILNHMIIKADKDLYNEKIIFTAEIEI